MAKIRGRTSTRRRLSASAAKSVLHYDKKVWADMCGKRVNENLRLLFAYRAVSERRVIPGALVAKEPKTIHTPKEENAMEIIELAR